MNVLKQYHRWIDRAWLDEGLCRSSPAYPPWRLEAVPILMILFIIPLDYIELSWPIEAAIGLALGIGAVLQHLYFGWRLSYLTSMTEISQKIARSEEPSAEEVMKFTD